MNRIYLRTLLPFKISGDLKISNIQMQQSIKQSIRKVFQQKKIMLIHQKNKQISFGLQQQFNLLFQDLLRTGKVTTYIAGSYLPDLKRELVPPMSSEMQWAYPRFIRKSDSQPYPQMEFKIIPKDSINLETIYGIQVPPQNIKTVFPSLFLVPLTSFHSRTKHRIGYGGGYYDRYIRSARKLRPDSIFIGVGAEGLQSEGQFWNELDEALDYVITDKCIY